MKRLLLPLLAALAVPTAVEANWFGKYNSKFEANEACKSWAKKGKKYSFEYIDQEWINFDHTVISYGNKGGYLADKLKSKTVKSTRRCIEENDTNQILGFEKTFIRAKNYTFDEWNQLIKKSEEKVQRNFKY